MHLYDIGVRVPPGTDVGVRQAEIQSTFEALMAGDVEADGFNRLVSLPGLTARQVSVLRAYAKYLRRSGSRSARATSKTPFATAARGVEPGRAVRVEVRTGSRRPRGAAHRGAGRLAIDLDAIQLLDDDRICRGFMMLIDATVRTNCYRGKPTLSFKLDPAAIPDLPTTAADVQNFRLLTAVEGVHLRAGPIARVGFAGATAARTSAPRCWTREGPDGEGRSAYVPVGAKGGFVVKSLPADAAGQRLQG